MGRSVDDVMPRRDGPENFEKRVVEIWPLKMVVEFSTIAVGIEFLGSRPAEMNCDLKHHKMRCALGWGQHSMVSIGF